MSNTTAVPGVAVPPKIRNQVNEKTSFANTIDDFKITFRGNNRAVYTDVDTLARYLLDAFDLDSKSESRTTATGLVHYVIDLTEEKKSSEESDDSNKIVVESSVEPEHAQTLWWLRFYRPDPHGIQTVPMIRLNPHSDDWISLGELEKEAKNAALELVGHLNKYTVRKKFRGKIVEEPASTAFNNDLQRALLKKPLSVFNATAYKKRIPTLLTYLTDTIHRLQVSPYFLSDIVVLPYADETVPGTALIRVNLDEIRRHGGQPTPFIDAWEREVLPDYVRPAFRAYLWSVLSADENHNRILYVHDSEGGTGKSTFFTAFKEALTELHPKFVKMFDSSILGSKEAATAFYETRLALDSDGKNPNIARYSLTHKLTDWVRVRKLYKEGFDAKLSARLIVLSNQNPHITLYRNNEVRRILYVGVNSISEEYLSRTCEVDENGRAKRDGFGQPLWLSDPDKNFNIQVKREMRSYLASCEEDYKRELGGRKDFLLPEEYYAALRSACADSFYWTLVSFAKNFLLFDDSEAFSSYEALLNSFLQIKRVTKEKDFVADELKLYLTQDRDLTRYHNVRVGTQDDNTARVSIGGLRGIRIDYDKIEEFLTSRRQGTVEEQHKLSVGHGDRDPVERLEYPAADVFADEDIDRLLNEIDS